jgi:hypothetical protein
MLPVKSDWTTPKAGLPKRSIGKTGIYHLAFCAGNGSEEVVRTEDFDEALSSITELSRVHSRFRRDVLE